MKLVDAGVVLKFLINDGSEESEAAQALFKNAAKERNHAKDSIILLHGVLFEVFYVLEKYYQAPRRKVVDIMANLINSGGVHVPRKRRVITALGYYVESHYDLIDCYLASELELGTLDTIYSFDEEFDHLGVKRVDPRSLT